MSIATQSSESLKGAAALAVLGAVALAAAALWPSCITEDRSIVLGPIACTNTADCPGGTWCSATTGCCTVATGGCEAGSCPLGDRCACDGRCYPADCLGDGDCSANTFCNSNGECQAKTGCGSDQDCPCSELCGATASCVPGCKGDADCCDGQFCKDGSCFEPIGCKGDTDCPKGSYCETDGTCVAFCKVNEDCPAGSVCGDNGFCYQSCSAAKACPSENMICGEDGFCYLLEGCVTDADCEEGELCGSDYNCYANVPCNTNDDCPKGAVCSEDKNICVIP